MVQAVMVELYSYYCEDRNVVHENLNAGYHTYTWNASNHASGIYFLQMTTSKFTSVNKMLLVK